MKYAIMSDVHANPDALETALADARKRGCGRFLMLGDITGYGYDPKRTLKIVRDDFDVVLMGNHDSACIGKEPAISVMFNPNYDLAVEARDLLSKAERQWLGKRGYLHEEDGFACTHGDFTRPREWRYVFGCEDAVRNFFSRPENLMFCGHTHRAAVWEQTAKGLFTPKCEGLLRRPVVKPESVSFALKASSRYIVNVGSTGNPRNDLCITYCIYDSDARRVVLRRLPFDFASYIKELIRRQIDLPAWLQELLERSAREIGGEDGSWAQKRG